MATQVKAPAKAIDYMYYYLTPKIKDEWETAKKAEIVCRMELAVAGGLPSQSPEEMISLMDQSGMDRVFLCSCIMFSYWQKKVIMPDTTEDIAKAVKKYPKRFVGMASYNPYRIKESLQTIEKAAKEYGFKGVYVHIYGFDLPLTDARMYPLYAKCQELDIVVSMQVGYVLEAMPSEHARPMMLDRIALDFPGLKIIGSHTGYPWEEELIAVCYKHDSVYFGADAHRPKYWSESVKRNINSRLQDKCIFGTNGLPWKMMLQDVEDLGLKEEVKKKLLRDNAVKLFKLD
ncbi:MAG: amidohydrolase family protein [Dehalococcoidia bacterium]|nr:amidohydrolase family protein [Dehalococcoidia bacterium]